MRAVFFLILLAGAVMGFVYPWYVTNFSGNEMGSWRVHERGSTFRPVTVALSSADEPVRVLVDMTALAPPKRQHQADEADRAQGEADRLQARIDRSRAPAQDQVDRQYLDVLGVAPPDDELIVAFVDTGEDAGLVAIDFFAELRASLLRLGFGE